MLAVGLVEPVGDKRPPGSPAFRHHHLEIRMAIETARSDAIEPGEWSIAAERNVGRARLSLLRSG